MPKKATTKQYVRDDINPQLCKTYNPVKHKWDHEWIVEPKFDGLRCNVVADHLSAVGAYSRNGKPLWNMFPILIEIADTHKHIGDLKDGFILDGEVYTTDWNLSMSIVKRSTQTHPDQDKLRYHIWDALTAKEWKAGKSDVSNVNRKERLAPWSKSKYVQIVSSKCVSSDKELQVIYQEFLEQGYEGAILKDPNGIYEKGRRSPSWLKVKPWYDADLKVVGSYPGEGKHTGRIGGLIVEGDIDFDGELRTVRTEVGTGFTDQEREEFHTMDESGILVGRIVEIKFQEITSDGSCRFPVYNRLREDKE